jgi:hypothetical protein
METTKTAPDPGLQAFRQRFLPVALHELAAICRGYAIDWGLGDSGRERIEYSFTRTLLGIDVAHGDRLLRHARASLGDAPSSDSIIRWMRAYFGPERAGRRVPAIVREIRMTDSMAETWDDGSPRLEPEDPRGDIDAQADAAADDRRRDEQTRHREWFAALEAAEREDARQYLDSVLAELRAKGNPKAAQALENRAKGMSYAESAAAEGRPDDSTAINTITARTIRAWNDLSPLVQKRIAPVCPPPARRPRR